ncbi:MAG: TolC family protein [Lutibacter sp.]|nr:TolC family protein [Lutibacter sp.]MDT8417877.1 TolC family protein [Lutibacter sp.]
MTELFSKFKLRKKAKILFSFFSLLSLGTYAQDLSLKQAYEFMLEKNGDLNASEYHVQSVDEERKAMKGLYYPTVSVSGSYIHLDKDITVDLNASRDMVGGLMNIPNPEAVLGDWNFNLLDRNFGFASANINWTISAGGKINVANEAANLKLDLSENQHQLKKDELTLKLIEYYFKLKLANEAENLRNEIYKTVEMHNSQANKLFNNGMIAEVETLNAKVSLSNAKRELMGAQKDVSLAMTAIQNLIGGSGFNNISTKFTEPVILSELSDIQKDMLNKNSQLKLIDDNFKLAKIGTKIENSEYYPKIAAFGKQSLWKDNLSFAKTNWIVGINAEWTIFNGFQREHKIKAAKHKVSQVQKIKKQARLSLATYTEKIYNELQKQQEQYESLNADEILADKLKFMRTRAFEEGTGTSIEVIDATLKLTEIKLHKIEALYHYNVAYGELMVQLGETENFLNKN